MKSAFCLSVVLLLAGCGGGQGAANLLRDPAFEVEKTGPDAIWRLSQHAGPPSYRWAVEDGVLSATRIGPEPWGQATQIVSGEDLVGRRLAFSAELAGELEPDSELTVEATGIGVRVKGRPPGMPAVMGAAIQLSRLGEPPLPRGRFDWTEQRVEFVVPEGAQQVEVSIRLGTGGTLRVRKPRLIEVESG